MERIKLIQEARDLYVVSGLTISQIATALAKSRNTIAAWRRRESEAGHDWDELRNARLRESPFAPLDILKNRLLRLLKSEEEHADDKGYDDQLYKLHLIIEAFEEKLGDAKRILDALEVFGAWAANKLPDEKLEVVRKAVEGCMNDLRTGKFGLA